ncbi:MULTISPECIES: zf-HC2 domain-containing protein [unclassified Kitasatospora]|uniref:zf-HC2 domain-containing protein n=1 Tax=unclassified Kitasatospora TaxID=2633591 RepID=UPI0033D10ECE
MTAHAPRRLLVSYVLGPDAPAGPTDGRSEGPSVGELWAVEAHLERCAVCRAELAEVSLTHSPAATALVEQVRERLSASLSPVRRRRWRRARGELARWAAPAFGPWVAALVLVVLCALVLASAVARDSPTLLLLAPAMPLLGVALSWGPHTDPVHELVATTPRAGLALVLRRTVAVLAFVIPPLAVGGWITGTAPVLVLLPALALTCAALALGSRLGVQRAATALGVGWAAFVVIPAMDDRTVPVYLRESAAPGWAAAVAALGVAVVLCRNTYLHSREARVRRR